MKHPNIDGFNPSLLQESMRPHERWTTVSTCLLAPVVRLVSLFVWAWQACLALSGLMSASIRDWLRSHAARRAFYSSLSAVCLAATMLHTGDANAALSAPALWAEVKGVFFSEWGLVIGVVILCVAIGAALQYGIGKGFAFAAVGTALFLVPGGVATLQNWGSSLSP